MDYASHAPLPSLGPPRADIFEFVPAGRSFRSVQRKMVSLKAATIWRANCRGAVQIAVTMPSARTYSLASRVAALARLPRKE